MKSGNYSRFHSYPWVKDFGIRRYHKGEFTAHVPVMDNTFRGVSFYVADEPVLALTYKNGKYVVKDEDEDEDFDTLEDAIRERLMTSQPVRVLTSLRRTLKRKGARALHSLRRWSPF